MTAIFQTLDGYPVVVKPEDLFSQVRGAFRLTCHQHPLFVADLTGDGIADPIGFGSQGVCLSLNGSDGVRACGGVTDSRPVRPPIPPVSIGVPGRSAG